MSSIGNVPLMNSRKMALVDSWRLNDVLNASKWYLDKKGYVRSWTQINGRYMNLEEYIVLLEYGVNAYSAK